MTTKVEIDPTQLDAKQKYKILTGTVIPRPIGFISTVSVDGVYNAAPFSFFNVISDEPPIVCFSCTVRAADNGHKHTLINARETGDFVVNVVDEQILVAQGVCSKEYPAEVDELAVSGLTPVSAKLTKSPLIAESLVNMECRVLEIKPLPQSSWTLVIGQVVYLHLAPSVYRPDGRIDMAALNAVGRLAGNYYADTRGMIRLADDRFERLPR